MSDGPKGKYLSEAHRFEEDCVFLLNHLEPVNSLESSARFVKSWAEQAWATAAKLAREETLELAVKAARDSLLKWKVSTAKWREYDAADIEADIRGTLAAQPSPQKENVK